MTARPLVLRNHTRWATADLRRIVAAGLAAHGLVRCTVHITYARRAAQKLAGRARIGTRGSCATAAGVMWLYLPRPPADGAWLARLVASTVDHEVYHLRGLRHGAFPAHARWVTPDAPPPWWGPALGAVAWCAPAAPKPRPTAPERRAVRLAHAQALLAKAVTRTKRAATIEARWAKTVRRIEREIEKANRLNGSADRPVLPASDVNVAAGTTGA
jgi:hypothetical protein